MIINQRYLINITLLVLVLVTTGCAGTVKNMQPVALDKIRSGPDQGQSMIVFMRPSTLGFAIQSSVFEVNDNDLSLVGVVAAKKKVAYQLNPGSHLFMVIAENADFMSADLEANKTYYALVTPRMGVWKARFSLKPIHAEELKSDQFNKWLASGEWVETSTASNEWATKNMPSIKSKHKKYYKKWMSKDASLRPKLLPNDGK